MGQIVLAHLEKTGGSGAQLLAGPRHVAHLGFLQSPCLEFKGRHFFHDIHHFGLVLLGKSCIRGKLEQDIVRVSDGLKDEQKRVADEKRRKNEKEYNRYFKRAQVKFRKENYRAAKKDVDQAKRYMKTKDLDSLEQRINLALRQSVQARIVKLIDLPSGMVNKYNEMIKHIEVANIGRGVKALGQIGLTLQVQQNGQLSIQRVNDQQMTVTPARSKRSINAKILRKITSIYLSPPIDKMGKSVVVRDWRVSYTVGTFMGKIILRRKF